MASDGKWYAPQLHHDPAYRAKYAEPAPVDVDESPSSNDADEGEVVEPSSIDTDHVVEAESPVVEVDATDEYGSDNETQELAPVDDDFDVVGRPEASLEPQLEDDTPRIIAAAGPPPEIRWPDLPPADAAKRPENDEPAADDDEDWISHGPAADADTGGFSVGGQPTGLDTDRPKFQVDLPDSVGEGGHGGGSRAQLEIGRESTESLASPRATSGSASFESEVRRHLTPAKDVTTTTPTGLSEIRIYREEAEIVDRIIAGALFLAGLAMIVGTFADWISEAGADTTGWDRGDGIATVLAGVLGAAAAGPIFVGFRHIVPKTVAIVSGLVGAVVVGLVGLDVISDTSSAGTGLGVGFWIVMVGSLLMIGAGIAERTSIT